MISHLMCGSFLSAECTQSTFCRIRLAALFIHDNRMLAERAFYC